MGHQMLDFFQNHGWEFLSDVDKTPPKISTILKTREHLME